MVEFVNESGMDCWKRNGCTRKLPDSCIPVHAYGAFKGGPHVQPIIFAIDNLSTCLTLNTLLHFHSPPFTTSNNSFALWYNLIWHLLQHLKHIAILFTWIKGHADFPGNDAADSVSKWSTNVLATF